MAKKHHLRFVILHGSHATGHAREDSDIDIAVLGSKPIDFEQQLQLFTDVDHLFRATPAHDLDLKTLHGVDPLFRYEVVRDGRLLYGDLDDYEDYKAFALRDYEDAQPLFALERVLAERYQQHLNTLKVS